MNRFAFMSARFLKLLRADLNLVFDPVHWWRLKVGGKGGPERQAAVEKNRRASKN